MMPDLPLLPQIREPAPNRVDQAAKLQAVLVRSDPPWFLGEQGQDMPLDGLGAEISLTRRHTLGRMAFSVDVGFDVHG